VDETSGSSFLLGAVAVLALVGANAFFVAAEFSLVAARRTRIQAMVRRGDRRAAVVQRALGSLDKYISGTQLGITLASLGLGWIGEPIVAAGIAGVFGGLPRPFDAVATHAVAGTVAFLIITFLHIVLGELTPKALALLHPEQTSLWVAAPLIAFTVVTNPFIWLLNGTANGLLRLFGARAPSERERIHSAEELLMLVEQSEQSGGLGPETADKIERVFEFTDKRARDVMTPRTDIVPLWHEQTVTEAMEEIARSGRSRYPVYREGPDDVVGIVLVKDVLRDLRSAPDQRVSEIMRPPFFVPGSREVEDVLTDMRRRREHMAIVLDEYGGTAGLVTMEDLIEELVGEIYDEYERRREDAQAPGAREPRLIAGQTDIAEVNRRFGLKLKDDQHHTIGGYVFGRLEKLPAAGDRVPVPGGTLEVVSMRGPRVTRVRFIPKSELIGPVSPAPPPPAPQP
jgi:CBS domain containing-hemolysin-like protein